MNSHEQAQLCPRLWKAWWLLLVVPLALTSCRTYYQRHLAFNQAYEQGQYESALSHLKSDEKADKSKVRLLHYLDKGVALHMLGDYKASNAALEQAYFTAQDYRKRTLNQGLSMLTNPMAVAYGGEDHEILYLHYYKALNFIFMNDLEAALVEVRRMNNLLNVLSDKYKREDIYKRDAFIHLLMGLIYDASGEYNDAFIAYRNAYEVYREDFQPMFGIGPPEQLKQDLVRAACLAGLDQECDRYSEELGVNYGPPRGAPAQLIVLWNNGLAPVKTEWGLSFSVVEGAGGAVSFRNDQWGNDVAFVGTGSAYDASITNLNLVRVTLPRYQERPVLYESATVVVGGKQVPLELGVDLAEVARQALRQRMAKIVAEEIARVAVKQLVQELTQNQNEYAGLAVSIFNAVTQKADTRGWQTYPHSISYARVPLKPSSSTSVTFQARAEGRARPYIHKMSFNVPAGETHFHVEHTP